MRALLDFEDGGEKSALCLRGHAVFAHLWCRGRLGKVEGLDLWAEWIYGIATKGHKGHRENEEALCSLCPFVAKPFLLKPASDPANPKTALSIS